METTERKQVAMDVTDLSPKEIEHLSEADHAEGFMKNGIFFPNQFAEVQGEKHQPTIKVKTTKKTLDIYSKYGDKGFSKDGGFNYSSWSDQDLINEIASRKDKGKSKARTNFLRALGVKRLIRIKPKIGLSKKQETTKTQLVNSIEKFIERGDPSAEAKYKRKLAKKKAERLANKKINKKAPKEPKDVIIGPAEL